MFGAFSYALVSVLLVSAVSLIGLATLGFRIERLKKVILLLVSFAAGALLGDVFLHLIPELVEDGFLLSYSFIILGGIGFSFVVEKFIHWRHCHLPTTREHTHPVATMNLVGDGVHNFIDGIIIGASYLVSVPAGIATTLAVFLHEIPQEIGDFGVLLHAGYTRKKALLMNFLLALTSFLGAFLVFALGSIEGFVPFLVAFAIGNFIYIAGSDLIPELHKEVGLKSAFYQLLSLAIGVLVMASLLLLE
ncbi:MAG: ZIP family metal transporter [Nanoarchaeota archaeon]